MKKIAIIGGSGVYKFDKVDIVTKHFVDTPFGHTSGPIFELKTEENHFYFLARHGEGHRLSPTEINYRANIYALKSIGVDTAISVSAVGSLKEEYAPTHFVLPDQFIDWTKGLRARSFFSEGVVGHVSTANPVHLELQSRIAEALEKTDTTFHKNGTYLCIEGPQFSTRAESKLYRSFGADVIGMTNVPEAFLAKEAGMAYGAVSMVTDFDAWKEEHCTLEEIMKVMQSNYTQAQNLIKKLIPHLVKNPIDIIPENKNAIVTDRKFVSDEQDLIHQVLFR